MRHLFQLEAYLCLTKHSSGFDFGVIPLLDRLQTNAVDAYLAKLHKSKLTNRCYRLEQFDLNIIIEDSKNPSTPKFQMDWSNGVYNHHLIFF